MYRAMKSEVQVEVNIVILASKEHHLDLGLEIQFNRERG
jgi:hypothetical protein